MVGGGWVKAAPSPHSPLTASEFWRTCGRKFWPKLTCAKGAGENCGTVENPEQNSYQSFEERQGVPGCWWLGTPPPLQHTHCCCWVVKGNSAPTPLAASRRIKSYLWPDDRDSAQNLVHGSLTYLIHKGFERHTQQWRPGTGTKTFDILLTRIVPALTVLGAQNSCKCLHAELFSILLLLAPLICTFKAFRDFGGEKKGRHGVVMVQITIFGAPFWSQR